MKKKIFTLAVVLVLLLVGTCSGNAGNGAPSGKHYTLNLLGKDWEKEVRQIAKEKELLKSLNITPSEALGN